MPTTGNIYPGTGENNAGIGATAWSTPGNITADDASNATCNAGASSQYLVARNFNFSSVPDNATIVGVTVRIEATESSAGAETLNARLQDETGTLTGSSKTVSLNGNSPIVYTYGGTSDVWGATLTPAIVKDADFGVRFWFTTSHNVLVDYVTMAIEYTLPAPPFKQIITTESYPLQRLAGAGAVFAAVAALFSQSATTPDLKAASYNYGQHELAIKQAASYGTVFRQTLGLPIPLDAVPGHWVGDYSHGQQQEPSYGTVFHGKFESPPTDALPGPAEFSYGLHELAVKQEAAYGKVFPIAEIPSAEPPVSYVANCPEFHYGTHELAIKQSASYGTVFHVMFDNDIPGPMFFEQFPREGAAELQTYGSVFRVSVEVIPDVPGTIYPARIFTRQELPTLFEGYASVFHMIVPDTPPPPNVIYPKWLITTEELPTHGGYGWVRSPYQETPPNTPIWPDPTDVRSGIQYGPSGNDYVGTYQPPVGGGNSVYLRRR